MPNIYVTEGQAAALARGEDIIIEAEKPREYAGGFREGDIVAGPFNRVGSWGIGVVDAVEARDRSVSKYVPVRITCGTRSGGGYLPRNIHLVERPGA